MKNIALRDVVVAAAFMAFGLLTGYFGDSWLRAGNSYVSGITREGGYEFINPLLSCDIAEDVPYGGFSKLRNAFVAAETRLKDRGAVTRMSVYFRALDRGYWTGINVDDEYIPASLGKVPLAVAVVKDVARDDFQKISIQIPAEPDQNASEFFPPIAPLERGRYHTLETLTKSMLQDSDNNAMQALLGYVATSTLDDVYGNFALPFTEDKDRLSPKIYGRVFRILYNASYLPRLKSQDILRMLAGTHFQDGIVLPLPKGSVVSHKFAERTVYGMGGVILKRELHDCGIVYYPHTPYLLCVMTEGRDFAELEEAIQTISSTAYGAAKDGLLANLTE